MTAGLGEPTQVGLGAFCCRGFSRRVSRKARSTLRRRTDQSVCTATRGTRCEMALTTS